MTIDVDTNDIQNVASSTAAQTINNNFSNIRDALEKALNKEENIDNNMEVDLDMDGNSIINVGTLNSFDISSLSDLQDAVDASELSASQAATSASESLASETASSQHEQDAEDSAQQAQSYAQAALNASAQLKFDTVTQLLSDNTILGYSGALVDVQVGNVIDADSYHYTVADSSATDEHLTTAGGVKLYVKPSGGVYNFQAFGANDSSDSSSSVLLALNSVDGKPLVAGGETIRVDTPITYTGVKAVIRDVMFDFTNGGQLSIEGGLTPIPTLSADLSKSDNTVSFSSAHGLSRGDVFCVYNDTDFSFSSQISNAHDGDWFRVKSIDSATQVTIYGHVLDPYLAVDMTCGVMGGGVVELTNIECIAAPNSTKNITIVNHVNVKVKNIVFHPATASSSPSQARGLNISQCFEYYISDYEADITDGNNSYPLGISNSRNGYITGVKNYSSWHAISHGGGTGLGCVPMRQAFIQGCHFFADGNVGASDTHSQSDLITYDNCIMDQATSSSGRNITLSHCHIYSRLNSSPYCIYASRPMGGYLRILDCTLEIEVDTSSSWGAINISKLERINEDFVIEINNLHVINHASNTNLRLIKLDGNTLYPHKVDLRIGTIHYSGPDLFSVIALSSSVDQTSVMTLSLEDFITTNGLGTNYLIASNSANYNMSMRMPKQVVYQDLSLTTSLSSVTGTAVSLLHTYPRRPEVVGMSWHTSNGASNTWGSLPIQYIYDVEKSTVRQGVKTADGGNFANTRDVRCVATVGIQDF